MISSGLRKSGKSRTRASDNAPFAAGSAVRSRAASRGTAGLSAIASFGNSKSKSLRSTGDVDRYKVQLRLGFVSLASTPRGKSSPICFWR